MPRGGGRGKRSHKGQRRQFTQPEDLKAAAAKEERERQWRRQRGIDSDEEQGEEGKETKEKSDEAAASPATTSATTAAASDGSSSEEESSDDEKAKAKGVEHLISVENPNRAAGKRNKKVSELGDAPSTTNLSRREREELEKQEARRRYQQMHLAGKTDEAQADLARLAIIRKQREEAARKKEDERKAKEDAKQAAAKTKGKS